MIEIICDICNEKVNRFRFYKLEQTICSINGEGIEEADEYFYDAPSLYSGKHLCETCLNRLNGQIAYLIANSRQ